MMTPIQRFLHLAWMDRASLFLLGCYATGAGLLALAVPLAAQALVNTIVQGLFLQPLLFLTGAVFLGLILSGVLKAMQLAIAEGVQQRLFSRLGLRLTELIPQFDSQAFRGQKGPEELNKFFEVVNIQKSWNKLLLDVPASAVELLLSFGFLALYGPNLLTLAVLASVLAIFLITLLGYGGLRSSMAESKSKYQLAGWLEQVARSQDSWKLANAGRHALQISDVLIARYLKYRQSHFSVLLRQVSTYYFFNALVVAGLLGYGGWMVIERQISVGQLVAIEIVILNLLKSAEKLVRSAEAYFDLLTGLDKVGHLLETPLERAGDRVAEQKDRGCDLNLRGLIFGYSEKKPDLINQLDLTVAPLARISILGLEGEGKSTLAQLMAGLLRPQRGSVEVEGIEVSRLQRGTISWLHAGHELLDASVEENIQLGRELPNNDIRWALEMSGLNDHLPWLDAGLETEICWAGKNLSSAQVTRLQLARSLAGRPGLLLLDHELSALAPEGRRRVLTRLFDSTRPWTLVNFTSDCEALARSQQIFWLQEGELIELGSPQQAIGLEESPIRRHFPTLARQLAQRLEEAHV